MRAKYLGRSGIFRFRLIELSYADDEFEEFQKVIALLRERGWSVDDSVENWGGVEIDHPDDFRCFMEDWKDCKRIARKEGGN